MEHIITLLQTYKYLILLPIVVIEGPIVTVLAGFLVSMHQFNLFLVYIIVVVGDAIGDSACYLIGRFGSKILNKHGPKIGVTPKKIARVERYFNTHRKKALFYSKILHGIGFTGLIVAGTLKIPYRKFFTTCFLTTLGKTIIFLGIGILFGHAYNKISHYLNYYSAGSIIVSICFAGYIFIRKFKVILEKE